MQLTRINKDVAGKFLAADDTYAFTLMTIVLSTFPETGMEMDSALLFAELRETYGEPLSEESENKINAAITVMTSDLMSTDVTAFKAVVLGLVEGDIGGIPDGDDEDIDASSIFWAMLEAGLLRGDAIDPEEYSNSVQQYAESVIRDEALDSDSIDDDVDTVEELKQVPYFRLFGLAHMARLRTQLIALGADPQAVNMYIPNKL